MKTLEMFGICEISQDEYEENVAKAFAEGSEKKRDSEILDEVVLSKGKRVLDSQQKFETSQKRPPGRPFARTQISALSILHPSPVEGFAGSTSERPSKYRNWFEYGTWNLIETSLKQHNYCVREAVRYLQVKYRIVGSSSSKFDCLNESTIRYWYQDDGRTLKPHIREVVEALKDQFLLKASGSSEGPDGGDSIPLRRGNKVTFWAGKEDLESAFVKMLEGIRSCGSILNSLYIQLLLIGFLRSKWPSALRENGGTFTCSRSWVRQWVRNRLGWSFRASTTGAAHMPMDYKEKGKILKLRMAYLVHLHGVCLDLIINMDQTAVRLQPVGTERTYVRKGIREVAVSGKEDKRQIPCCVTSSASGILLPFQLIFQGKTRLTIPVTPSAILLQHNGWHLTCTQNHWASFDTMKDWVDRILAPYYVQICKKHELQVGEQKMVLLLDCWAVHRGKEFRAFMEKNHPYVLLLYVPAGCTSIYQPADVAIQRPLKARFARSYHEWAIEQVKLSLDAGVEPTGTKFDVSIGTLRAKACEWMWNAHVHVADNPDLIRLGWSDCGLLDAWKFEVQKEALLANEEGKLFKEHIREQIGLEDTVNQDCRTGFQACLTNLSVISPYSK
ncbi:hypothetical protein R1sor_020811 [Riccia sorocarpa]|uniref:DDE-1 domain-containing protein n=1 Tax=Riccia sorocarpa TaxID=122646 RepID=A0ABD3GIE1_9MARC